MQVIRIYSLLLFNWQAVRRVSALERYEVLVIGPVMGGDLQPSLGDGKNFHLMRKNSDDLF